MKLVFLDDERTFKSVYWVEYGEYDDVIILRTAKEFYEFVGEITDFSEYEFSFDHDIQSYDDSGRELTGYDCAKYLCGIFMDKNIDPGLLRYYAHTMNPIGKCNIEKYIDNFKEYFS